MFRCANRGAELLQHPRAGDDELIGIDIQPFQGALVLSMLLSY